MVAIVAFPFCSFAFAAAAAGHHFRCRCRCWVALNQYVCKVLSFFCGVGGASGGGGVLVSVVICRDGPGCGCADVVAVAWRVGWGRGCCLILACACAGYCRGLFYYMAMAPLWGGCATYFDVHQGYRVLTHSHILYMYIYIFLCMIRTMLRPGAARSGTRSSPKCSRR